MEALSVSDKGWAGSKRTQDGITVLLEHCIRFEQIASVDSSRIDSSRIALHCEILLNVLVSSSY